MFCRKCGAPMKDGAAFCTKCGSRNENAGKPEPSGTAKAEHVQVSPFDKTQVLEPRRSAGGSGHNTDGFDPDKTMSVNINDIRGMDSMNAAPYNSGNSDFGGSGPADPGPGAAGPYDNSGPYGNGGFADNSSAPYGAENNNFGGSDPMYSEPYDPNFQNYQDFQNFQDFNNGGFGGMNDPGYAVSSGAAAAAKAKAKKRTIIVALLSVVIILAIGALVCVMLLFRDEKKSDDLISYIDKGQYSELYDKCKDMEKSERKDQKKDFMKGLADRYEDIQSRYSKGEVSSDDIESLTKTVEELMNAKNEEYEKFLVNIETIDSSKASFEAGQSDFEKGSYETAITNFKKVQEIDTARYSDAQDMIKKAEDKINEAKQQEEDERTAQMRADIEHAREKINSGDFDGAQSEIKGLTESYGSNPEIESLNQELKDKIISETDRRLEESYFEKSDYTGGYTYLEKISYKYGYEELEEKLSNYKAEYVDYALNKAERQASEDNYEGAANTIESAMGVVEEDSNEYYRLKNAYDKYKKFSPVYLNDLNHMSGDTNGGTANKDVNLTDNTDKTHEHSYYLTGGGKNEYYQTFYLDKKYSTLEFTVAVSSSQRSSEHTQHFEIYADNHLIYRSPDMNRESLPQQEGPIDISGVVRLKIVYPESDGDNELATIYDAILTPANESEP